MWCVHVVSVSLLLVPPPQHRLKFSEYPDLTTLVADLELLISNARLFYPVRVWVVIVVGWWVVLVVGWWVVIVVGWWVVIVVSWWVVIVWAEEEL